LGTFVFVIRGAAGAGLGREKEKPKTLDHFGGIRREAPGFFCCEIGIIVFQLYL
jgi:hypothetical protein